MGRSPDAGSLDDRLVEPLAHGLNVAQRHFGHTCAYAGNFSNVGESRRLPRTLFRPIEIPGTLISRGPIGGHMSTLDARDEESEDEPEDTIDRAVEEALDLDFASFQEAKEAFRD